MKFTVFEAQSNVMGEFGMCMLNAVTAGHIHHLTTNSFSQHMALGDFYLGIQALSDSFIEAYQGKYSKIFFGEKALFLGENGLELVCYVNEELAVYRSMPGFPQDTELQNIADEIATLCDSTMYKLRFLE